MNESSVCIIHRYVPHIETDNEKCNRQLEDKKSENILSSFAYFMANELRGDRAKGDAQRAEREMNTKQKKKCGRRDHKRCDNMHARICVRSSFRVSIAFHYLNLA